GVAEGAGLQETPPLCGGVRRQHVDRPAAGLHALAILFSLVARLPRNADEAARIEMVFAEISPHLGPGVIGFGDQRTVAGRGTVGATDDAVVVARCREWIGNPALLDEADAVA